MARVRHLVVRLASRPVGRPTRDNFTVQWEDFDAPRPLVAGTVVVLNTFLSLDPAMRGWMNDVKSYIAPVSINAIMRGATIGEVIESNSERFAVGTHVVTQAGWCQYAVAHEKDLLPVMVPPHEDITVALGPLGLTGMTAYFGLFDVGKPQKGQTILISAAAGATGSVVGQLARQAGLHVVGLAGSDEKCNWLRNDAGFHEAINYKTTKNLWRAVKSACPKGIDIYFDNVGGTILDTALAHINRGARVVICGAISQYNSKDGAKGPSNYLSLLVNRASMQGFVVFDYADRYKEAGAVLAQMLVKGQLSWRADIVDGLANAPEALLRLFDGENKGKLLIRINDTMSRL